MSSTYLAPTFPESLPDNPLSWAKAWLKTATDEGVQRNPNAMTLGTIGDGSRPSSRVVLCKKFVADPGYLVFYTNYRSRKIRELQRNPATAVTFHWDAMGRQVRLEGTAVLSPPEESDEYFASRDWGSQLGAWGSDQSDEIASRRALFEQVQKRAEKLGIAVSDDLQSLEQAQRPVIPRPGHWGGVRVWPDTIELWIEGVDRIHDRAIWRRSLTRENEHAFAAGPWKGTRLQP